VGSDPVSVVILKCGRRTSAKTSSKLVKCPLIRDAHYMESKVDLMKFAAHPDSKSAHQKKTGKADSEALEEW
jgi:hypothetical protein